MSDITREEEKLEQKSPYTVANKLWNASSWLYNRGLEKAKMRDLSGAIQFLNLSIKYSKSNVDARNLLGLIYFEVGEIVQALEQWVISRHIKSENNIAQTYINEIQANQSKLDNLNQAIVKYNGALAQVKQKSSDLAIIHLKKVITINPNFIKAYCLLALIYIKEGDYEKAKRQLNKVLEIDKTNPLANRYYAEIAKTQASTVDNKRFLKEVNTLTDKSASKLANRSQKVSPLYQLIFIIVGLIAGALLVFVLVLPGITIYQKQQTKQWKNKYEALEASKPSDDNSGDGEIEQLTGEIKTLQDNLEAAKADTEKLEQVDKLLLAVDNYMSNNYQLAAEQILAIDKDSLANASAETLYQTIKQETYSDVIKQNYNKGKKDYDNRKYEEALASLKTAEIYLDGATILREDGNGNTTEVLDPNYENVIYFIARCNHALGEETLATKYYEIIINNFKNYRNYQRAVNYHKMIND